jgi:sec-independent protein translocase protein TatA
VAALAGELQLIWKLLLVLAIILLIFGSARLPMLARSFGESITEFKKGIKGIEDQSEEKSEP